MAVYQITSPDGQRRWVSDTTSAAADAVLAQMQTDLAAIEPLTVLSASVLPSPVPDAVAAEGALTTSSTWP